MSNDYQDIKKSIIEEMDIVQQDDLYCTLQEIFDKDKPPKDWKMTEISKDMAEYLFNTNKEVYILHSDGSESLVEDLQQIRNTEELLGVEW
jgi:hypothetical protein